MCLYCQLHLTRLLLNAAQIKARDVLQTISSWAFEKSPFPVILSLEDHLPPEQQRVFAQQAKVSELLSSALWIVRTCVAVVL